MVEVAIDWKEIQRSLLDIGNVLNLGLGGGYTVYTYVKIHWAIHLLPVPFTVCKLNPIKNGRVVPNLLH